MTAQRLDVGDGNAAERHRTTRPDRRVERRLRRRQHRAHVGCLIPRTQMSRHPEAAPRQAQAVPGRAQRSRGARDQSVEQQAHVAGRRLGRRHLGDVRQFGRWRHVQEQGGEHTTGAAVEQAVVELHQHADATVDEPVQIPHLPQRVPTIELSAHDRRHGRGRLTRTARSPDRGAVDVSAQVEGEIVDPHCAIETERDLLQLPGELRHQRQPPCDAAIERVEPERGRSARIHDRQTTDVLVPRRCLACEEK